MITEVNKRKWKLNDYCDVDMSCNCNCFANIRYADICKIICMEILNSFPFTQTLKEVITRATCAQLNTKFALGITI